VRGTRIADNRIRKIRAYVEILIFILGTEILMNGKNICPDPPRI
jgi:hypothetical protein